MRSVLRIIMKSILYLIPLLVSIYFGLNSINNQKPVYYNKSTSSIIQDNVSPNIKILFNDKEVSNIKATEIAIWNAGNKFIDKQDISTTLPIKILPHDIEEILSVKVINKSRDTLKLQAHITESKKEVIIDIYGDDALEKNDGALFQILYSSRSDNENWEVVGRIKGIPKGFEEITLSDSKPLSLSNKFATIMYLGIIILLTYFIIQANIKKQKVELHYIILVVMCLLMTSLNLINFFIKIEIPYWIIS